VGEEGRGKNRGRRRSGKKQHPPVLNQTSKLKLHGSDEKRQLGGGEKF